MEEHPVLERVYDAICDLFPAHIEADADFHELETDAALAHDPDAVDMLREYHDFLRDEMDLDAMHPDDAFIGLSAEEQELIGVKKDLTLTADQQQKRLDDAVKREKRRINRIKKFRKFRMKWRTNREARQAIDKAGKDAKKAARAEAKPREKSVAQQRREEFDKNQAAHDAAVKKAAAAMNASIGRYYDEERYDDDGGRHDPRWYERDDWYHGRDDEQDDYYHRDDEAMRAYQRKYGMSVNESFSDRENEDMDRDLALLQRMKIDAPATTSYYDDVRQIEEEEEDAVGFYH